MFKNNRNLLIVALVAVVNALGYGIIIPILYSYSVRFGLSDFQNGLLFSLFSVCQFLSTPIIGRLSDKYGRKPLLIASIGGTAISFLMMAFAPSAIFLFIARALDGLTAGNLPVAAAVIADSTEPKDRAKGFGIIGAAFGFGFTFGPAISALTVGIFPGLPFVIAAIVSIVAVVITALFLPETNKHIGDVAKGKLFDFGKLFHALTDRNVGATLLISLFYFVAFGLFIYAFQPFSFKVLHLSAHEISIIFTVFGVLGLFSQAYLLPKLTKRFGPKNMIHAVLFIVAVDFAAIFFTKTLPFFLGIAVLMGLTNSAVQPLVQAILSLETDAKSQGTMQGLNSSYMSIGQIIGPIIGGTVATYSIPLPFLVASLFVLVCYALSFRILQPGVHKESAFGK